MWRASYEGFTHQEINELTLYVGVRGEGAFEALSISEFRFRFFHSHSFLYRHDSASQERRARMTLIDSRLGHGYDNDDCWFFSQDLQ